MDRSDLDDDFYDQILYLMCSEAEIREDFRKLNESYEQLRSSSLQTGGGRKRKIDAIHTASAKRLRADDSTPSTSAIQSIPPTTGVQQPADFATLPNADHCDVIDLTDNDVSDPDKIECNVCKILVKKRFMANHMRSNIHKNNSLTNFEGLPNVRIIDSAFGNRVVTYRITAELDKPSHKVATPEAFLLQIEQTIHNLLKICLNNLTVIKLNFNLHAHFDQQTKNLENNFDFQTSNYTFCMGDDAESIFKSIFQDLAEKVSNFERKDSGWSLRKIIHIDMNVNKFNPLRGSSYIDLPIDIKHKKAVINVKNNDQQCFQWAVLSALHPVSQNADRVTSYLTHRNSLDFGNIPFPVKLKDIKKFEDLNNVSINVFGLESDHKKTEVVGPLHFTKNRRPVHINLLLIQKGGNFHYCYIKNLSRLVSYQITARNGAVHICDGCLVYFPTLEQLNNHQKFDCAHVRVDLPNHNPKKSKWNIPASNNNELQFSNFERKLKLPFVIYADFEALLKPIHTCTNDPTISSTNNIQRHDAFSFGYYIKCSYDDTLSVYRTYSGENTAEVFIDYLKRDLEIISQKLTFQTSPLPLTPENHKDISQSKFCFICEQHLGEDFLVDYDWSTGLYRGVAHSVCASNYRAPRVVPCFYHNGSMYDYHLLIKALSVDEGDITVIPQNKEKYISFSKKLKINNNILDVRFLDSFRFMASSLDKLAQNLKPFEFKELRKNFPKEEDFKRLIKKGIFPYEYVTSLDVLNEKQLPPKEKFFNSLLNEHVSEENYNYAQDIWNHFCCENINDYSNLYLKTDVLLLTDIFENFREICIKTYGLDPAHYYTAPGLSWDAMLKFTQQKLELLTDFDKISFVQRGIRGGISQCSNRHAIANNIFMDNYDDQVPSSYLIYLDANNLYGWAMSQPLPTGEFEWIDANIDLNTYDDSEYGLILEVDLDYPDALHDGHSDFPFCPNNECVGDHKEKRLILSLENKKNYIIHYKNLKQCIANGLRLKKIHRVLRFRQQVWLKKYIDLNTEKRTAATSEFEKNFYKLMVNSVFGKFMENVQKRVDVRLLTHWENIGKTQGAADFLSKPNFHSISIFSESLVAVQLNKTRVMYDKPIYLGFCILDLSKTLMYDFHYTYMTNKFQNGLKLLYTDTDSLIYQVFTHNFYEDIKPDLTTYFDTSDYPSNNRYSIPRVNKKKLGLFKDENNGKIFKEFVGLRSKMYAIEVENEVIAKAKGVNKSVTKNFNITHYKNCLFQSKIHISEMLRFRSSKHVIFTQKINKVSLSYNDIKRCLLDNSTDTLAWGHYKLR